MYIYNEKIFVMYITEVSKINKLKERFDYEAYEKYLHGEVTYGELCNINQCTDHVMRVFMKQNSLDKRRVRIQKTTVSNIFSEIDNELKAYLLGFYFADGNAYKGYLHVTLNENDIEIVELFRNTISPYTSILKQKERVNKKTGYISKPMVGFSIFSKQICNDLEKFGIGEKKTYDANLMINKIPDSLLIHFIRGYFDGDGCVCKINAKRRYMTNSGEKISEVENFIFNITSHKVEHLLVLRDKIMELYGIKANIIKNTAGNYLIEINRKDDFFKMRDILYEDATYFLTRKKEKYYSIVPTKQKLDKKVKKINTQNGETVCTFNTMAEAGKEANITPQGMRVRIRKNLVIDGFKWEYA